MHAVKAPGAHLPEVDLSNEDVSAANLRGANLAYARLRRTRFVRADLGGASLLGTDLRDADLRFSNLTEIFARRAVLAGAKLCGARVTDSYLGEVNAARAKFTRASLRRAVLAFADLSGADLSGADLRGANLSDADLLGADLRGARLHGATLTGALFDVATRWPARFNPRERGGLLHDRPRDGALRMTDLKLFIQRLELAWKQRDWSTLSTALTQVLFYGTSDDIDDYFEYSDERRFPFLHRFLARGRVHGHDESGFWRDTFVGKWTPKIVMETVPKGRHGLWGMDDYDAYVLLSSQSGLLTIYFEREAGFWRIRGFYRNSA